MLTFFRNVVIILTLFILSTAGTFYYLSDKPSFWQWSAEQALKSHVGSPDVTFSAVAIHPMGESILSGLTASFERNKAPVNLSARSVKISPLDRALKDKQLDVKISGFEYKDNLFALEGLESALTFQTGLDHLEAAKGKFTAKMIGASGLTCTDPKGNVKASLSPYGKQEVLIDKLNLMCYGGNIHGRMTVFPGPKPSFDIVLDIKDISLVDLSKDIEALQGQVSGTLSGKLEISGTEGEPVSIKADFKAPKGGKINAALLEYIMSYLPANSSQYKKLVQMIAAGSMVALDDVSISVSSTGADNVSMNFDLFSKELNIKPNVTLDVNLDTEIHKIMELIGQ